MYMPEWERFASRYHGAKQIPGSDGLWMQMYG